MRIARFRGFEKIRSKTKHTLIVGISGYGKGMQGEWYIPKFVTKGFKVLDLNSQSRGEGMYYGIPNDDTNLHKRIGFLSGGAFKPQGYGNDIVMFLGTRLGDLTRLPENVRVCVFNEAWLTNDDLKYFLAINDSQEAFMEAFFEMHANVRIPLRYFVDFMKKAAFDKRGHEWQALMQWGLTHHGTIAALKKRAQWLLRSGIFHNEAKDIPAYFNFLDLNDVLKIQSKITSFSTYLIRDDFIRDVCIYMLLKKFIELLESRKIFTPLLFYMREGGDFFMRGRDTAYLNEIKNMISLLLRKGRSLGGAEITMVMDTQYPSDLPDHVFNGFNKIIAFNTSTSESKRFLRKCEIPMLYLARLSSAKVGMYMYIASGQFRYPLLALPTLHKKSDPSYDVFGYLGGKYGWRNYEESMFISILLHPQQEMSEFVVPARYYAKSTA